MATYKLIQDIEAEDHILGPLTLRQFIFALVAAFCFYISFILLAKHASFLLVLTLPPGLFCAFFAFPFGRDQPTEVWALAKLRFLIKPRRRIWDQSGMKELVTITAPKKVEPVRTDGLSQTEVKSRLSALANTLDSRGWAIKNVAINTYSPPSPLASANSDRLIDLGNIPQEVPNYDVQASDDILDTASNPIAQQFDHMITESTQTYRKHLIDELNDIRTDQATKGQPQPDYWFMSQPQQGTVPQGQAMFTNAPPVQPSSAFAAAPDQPSSQEEVALAEELKARNDDQQAAYANMHSLKPVSADQPVTSAQIPQAIPSGADVVSGTAPTDPVILSLANNNDLNVATLAREARKNKEDDESPNEVVISLH